MADAQLLALALRARDAGNLLMSEELIKLATEAFDDADDMERNEVQLHHQPPEYQPAQQQQHSRPEGETG